MMKKFFYIALLAISLVSCKQTEPVRSGSMTVTIGELKFEMVYVNSGSFSMGAVENRYAEMDEYPIHEVRLSDYYISRTEVSQALWRAIMDSLPSGMLDTVNHCIIADNYPVSCVSYDDCLLFIERLNIKSNSHFALPTEAQWEFAARSCNQNTTYAGSDYADQVAVCESSFPAHIGSKSPNAIGTFDMSGNVAEWCLDWYDIYPETASVMPVGPDAGTYRVIRGGSFSDDKQKCRVSARYSALPAMRSPNVGFRLILY